jgi:hypothetical protein
MEQSPRNPYAPPASAVGDGSPKAQNGKLYTPTQIRLGSFLGGPIAAVYFLRENFRVLGRLPEVRTTLIVGTAVVIGLLALLPFLPAHFPNYIVPLTYSYAAGAAASKWQLNKEAILDSGIYRLQSNWRVFGLSLLLLFAFVLALAAELICLSSIGIIHI